MPAHTLKLALLLLLIAAPLSAQNRKPRVEWERWEAEGTVAGYRGGALLMRLKGEPWIGALSPASKVSITGTADRDLLRPGVIVEFKAEFDTKTGAATEPVSELTIVTPRAGERRGAFPDEVIDRTERKEEPPPIARLRVYDGISGIKQNFLVFKKYRVELAPEAKIAVAVSNPSVLSAGDTVKKVKGKRIKGVQGRLVIDEIEVELAKPLGAEKRARSARSNSVSRKQEPKEPGEQPGGRDLFDIAGQEAAGKSGAASTSRKKGTKDSGDAVKKQSGAK